jgi:hypothetical protein
MRDEKWEGDAMKTILGLVKRIFGQDPKRPAQTGADSRHTYLDEGEHWSVIGVKEFPCFFTALPELLPAGSILYVESADRNSDVARYLVEVQVEPACAVEAGSYRPQFACHIPARPEVILKLAGLSERHAEPEVAEHVVAYCNDTIVLEWYDAPDDPISISKSVDEGSVVRFVNAAGGQYSEKHGPS